MKNKQKSSAKLQSAKFIAIAHKAGCDESEAAFEGKLRQIAKVVPTKVKPKRSK